MEIIRQFSIGFENSVYESVNWTVRQSELRNEKGEIIFKNDHVEAPENWSQLAVDVLASKYLKRTGIPKETVKIEEKEVFKKYWASKPAKNTEFTCENSLKQCVHRIVGNWTYWLIKENLITSEEEADIFYDEIAYMLIHQYFAPNSPQWFNTGLGWAYGLINFDEKDGYVFFDEIKQSVVTASAQNAACRQQGMACFILGVEDSMFGQNSIYDTITAEARVFRKGSGTGANWSKLRSKNEKLSSGGSSSGLMSFLHILDRSADSVKSGGATRRSAKLIVLDMDHPEIEDFIDWKLKEEQKVASLLSGSKNNDDIINRLMKKWCDLGSGANINHPEIKKIIKIAYERNIEFNYIERAIRLAEQGYNEMPFIKLSNDFNDEAYHTVSGQNSNNSVSITDSFLDAVHKGEKWKLLARTTDSSKEIDAKYLWDKIVYAAWSSADPGLLFKDTINAWNTCINDGIIRSGNPCMEFLWLDNNSCNLASLKLTKFINDDNTFNIALYQHAIELIIMALESTVNSALLPTSAIAEGTFKYRTLGIGYSDVGALLMRLGIAYDSEEACAWTGCLTAILSGTSYVTSAKMAKEIGTFQRFDANKDRMLAVIDNHRKATYGSRSEDFVNVNVIPKVLDIDYCPEYLLDCARGIWDNAYDLGQQYGYRNAQVCVIAPVGTIGLLMDCDTTGIEPDFSLIKYKKLAGGGYFKIVNQSVPIALKYLGYTDKQIERIIDYIIGAGTICGCPNINPDVLKKNGISEEAIAFIESIIPTSFNLVQCFDRLIRGNFDINFESGEKLLASLNLSLNQISEAENYIFGKETIEGAPYVDQEHYKIFDCANLCGKYGTRYIPYEAHIKIMSSAQTFVSGGISKTVNLPRDATIKDVEKCYLMAYSRALKGIAIYRDGSKLSQPLNSGTVINSYESILNDADFENEIEDTKVFIDAQMLTPLRRKLPKKRKGTTNELIIDGHKIYLRTGHYPNGKIGELFIDYAEENSFARTTIGLLAQCISISLQYGVPLEEFTDTLRKVTQEPRGLVNHDNVKIAKSIFDAVGKILAYEELGDKDAVEAPDPEEDESLEESVEILYETNGKTVKIEKPVIIKRERRSIDQCERCGSMDTVKISSCSTRCRQCGMTWGSCGG
jgi:ribonucleoside-diphosphate reductase alpha chain